MKKTNEADKKQQNSIGLAPPQPTQEAPAENQEDLQQEIHATEAGTEPEMGGIKLPVKKHIIWEIEDPFNKKDKSRIFADNLDLIELFKKGEFTEKQTLARQRAAIKARLKRKGIDPGTAKGVLNDYGYYFRKELETAKKIMKERDEKTATE